jgi:predicted choloylglycine hydrolase
MSAELTFHAVREDQPGERWRELFDEFWPCYEEWFAKEGDAARPTYAKCRDALRTHMPELVPLYEKLVDLAGGGDRVARFLSLYRPTPYLSGCSQAIWTRGGDAVLLRNYDYSPDYCDGVFLRSAWTGPATIASTDCLWGVLDGVNERGVAVALSFGGRKIVGDGFGLPLILRYVLEMAATTDQAIAILSRVPSHMAYNVSVCDAAGHGATVRVAPDHVASVSPTAVATNHQHEIEWPEHAMFTETVERARFLEACLADGRETRQTLAGRFLESPLYRTSYDRAWGTIYTAVYDCVRRTVEYRWPDEVWGFSFGSFGERTRERVFGVVGG